MQKSNEHQDPIRFPKLMEPIEQEMINLHKKTMKTLVVVITKKLVKQKK